MIKNVTRCKKCNDRVIVANDPIGGFRNVEINYNKKFVGHVLYMPSKHTLHKTTCKKK